MTDDSRIGEHIAAMLLHIARANDARVSDAGTLTIFEDEIVGTISDRFNVECPHIVIEKALETLSSLGALSKLASPFTGNLYEISASPVDYYFEENATPGVDDFGYYEERREVLAAHPIIRTYYRGREKWIQRVSAAIAEMDLLDLADASESAFGAVPEGLSVPAADRVVTLQDNQKVALDEGATDLLDVLERENAVDGDPRLRDKVLGQIRAGRELIRAQTFSAYLLYQTLLSTLGGLIERYKGHAIGIAATKLLELLIEHIFGTK